MPTKEKLIQDLKELTPDKWTSCMLHTSQGEYCGLGWILHKRGVSDEQLEQWDVTPWEEMVVDVEDILDLTPQEIDDIISLNDASGDAAEAINDIVSIVLTT